MNDELREIIAEEMGLEYCPIVCNYVGCGDECDICEYYKTFCKDMDEEMNK